jgi:acylphosphatase
MTQPSTELHARIFGRVQGVGFRYFVLDQASALGLTGWTRNLPDGSVEVVAQGGEDRLRSFLASLHRGPTGGRVDRVDSQFRAISEAYSTFRITR